MQNFQEANIVYGTNHYPFDDVTANLGTHKYIQFADVFGTGGAGIPTTAANQGALFEATVSGVLNLFYRGPSNPGITPQISGNVIVNATSGESLLFGGIIVKWALVSTAAVGPTAFTWISLGLTNFPTSCFGVVATAQSGSSNSTASGTTTTLSVKTASSAATVTFIIALGN